MRTSSQRDREEFARLLREPDEAFHKLVPVHLRMALMRAKAAAKEIETIGVALRAKWIDGDTALAWLSEEALGYVQLAPPGEQQGESEMDPDVTLERLRRLIDASLLAETDEQRLDDAEEICELISALDDWLSKGGLLPKQWREGRGK